MTKSSHIIFMKGKEKALDSLFSAGGEFAYLAIGYNPSEDENGFEDNYDDSSISNGFMEIDEINVPSYKRIPLEIATEEPVDFDPDTGKVLKKYKATLSSENISTGESQQYINQVAVVNNQNKQAESDIIYCAATFKKFLKSDGSSITFLIGFKL